LAEKTLRSEYYFVRRCTGNRRWTVSSRSTRETDINISWWAATDTQRSSRCQQRTSDEWKCVRRFL